MKAVPLVRLRVTYLFFFSIIGALIPFMGRFLREQGFSFSAISQVAALMTLATGVGPFLWATLSDRTGRRMPWARLGALLLLVSALSLFFLDWVWTTVLLLLACGLFKSSVTPQLEAVTLEYLGSGSDAYGSVRLWGTLGFAIVVFLLGPVLTETGARWMPLILAMIVALALLAMLNLPDVPANTETPREQATWRQFSHRLRERPVWGMYVGLFLWSISMAAYNTFYDLYLQDQGYGGMHIGVLLAVAPLAEMCLFIVLGRWLRLSGPRLVLMIALTGSATRWLLTAAFADQLWVLLFAQLGHALSFGAVHGSAMFLMRDLFPDHQQGRAQALYLAFSTALGMVVGNLVVGQVWSLPTGPVLAYYGSAAMALCSLVLIAVTIPGPLLRHVLPARHPQ